MLLGPEGTGLPAPVSGRPVVGWLVGVGVVAGLLVTIPGPVPPV